MIRLYQSTPLYIFASKKYFSGGKKQMDYKQYIEAKLNNIINTVKKRHELDEEIENQLYQMQGSLSALDGLNNNQNTLSNRIVNNGKSYTFEDFINLRFPNENERQKFISKRSSNIIPNKNEELTLSKFEGKNEDFTTQNSESEDKDIKYSITFRDKENRYMGRFTFLKKRQHVYGKTYNECLTNCRKKYKDLMETYATTSRNSNNSLNKWFDYFIENIKRPQIKESTYVINLELYNRHVRNNTITNLDIKNISSIKLQSLINGLTSNSARKRIHQLLNEVFDMLQKMAIVKINPMAVVIVPKNKDECIIETTEENKVLRYEDEIMLLEKVKKSQCYHAVKFILYSGLRRGECIGLMWKHINFENMTITINQQWNESTKKITTTKSKAGNRVIPILPQALEVLNELKKSSHLQDDFVFKGITRLTQHLVAHSKSLPFKVNPHMLRHTFASRCYFAGLDPKRIQALLGHESMSTTLDTYTHVLEFEDKEVINQIKDFFISINMID